MDETDPLAEARGEAADPAAPAERLRELARHPQLAPIVAANPSAPADLLRELGARLAEALPIPAATAIALMTHGAPGVATERLRELGLRADDPLLAAVAANPNTPVDTLIRLAGVFPAQLCANPVFPLLLLENPNLPGEMPVAIVRGLLRYAGVPSSFLAWLVSYGMAEVAGAARLHVSLAGEAGDDWQALAQAEIWKTTISESADLLLELLSLGAAPEWMLPLIAASGDLTIRRALARSPHTPRATLRPFRRAGASSDLAGYAPPDPRLAPETLAWLAEGGVYARRIAARNPATPPPLLDLLAADPDRSVRQGAARNPGSTPLALERLACDATPDVRQLVARNPNTPPDILRRLADDLARDVRWAAARNPGTPPDAIERLAVDASPVVRQGVARNPATPGSLLVALARDPHRAVRLAAARSPRTPSDAILRLVDDADEQVRAAAARHHAAPAQLRPRRSAERDGAPAAMKRRASGAADARQPDLAAEQPGGISLDRLAGDGDPCVRAAAAAHPDAGEALLRRLAGDEDPRVRAAVGRNPGAPAGLLEWLADDDVMAVHRAVAENPSAPAGLLERLAGDYTWTNARTRLAVVRNPRVTAEILEWLAGDLSVEVRRAVMGHPATPAQARSRILASSLDMCARTSESFYHVLALAHPAAPAAYVEARAGSPEWLERYAISRNPRAPRHVLAALADDGNRLVRASARAALAWSEE